MATTRETGRDATGRTGRSESIRLGPWHQSAVYAATVALVASGAIWVVLHYFFTVPGEYGPQMHPLESWMLKIHGAAAMAGLIVYGSLLPLHVRRAWTIRRNIALGIALIVLLLALTITGYLLYYAGGEQLRPLVSAAHWIPGLVVPVLLAWHVVSGRAATRAGTATERGKDGA